MSASPVPLPMNPAFVSTTDSIAGHKIVRTLGVAEGICVNPSTGILPSGRENALRETMKYAFLYMLEQAAAQGAQAIIGLRYAFPECDGPNLVIAYGTAVTVQKIPYGG